MLTAFVSALKTPDLRKKILFTLAMIAVYRAGATLPSPGVNYQAINDLHQRDQRHRQRRLHRCSTCSPAVRCCSCRVFALGIMPYITASIIVQLLDGGHPAVRAAEEAGPGRPTS